MDPCRLVRQGSPRVAALRIHNIGILLLTGRIGPRVALAPPARFSQAEWFDKKPIAFTLDE
jgi:hypothetical protein